MTLEDLHNAISLPESADGHWPSKLPNGQLMFQFGLEVVPVNHLAQPVNERASKTTGTCGQSSGVSLTSAALQQSLENKLRQKMEGIGSPLYALTWKHWDMQSGPPICALRALGHRTSGNDYSGWPTATVGDSKNTRNATAIRSNPNSKHHSGVTLTDAATLAGWPTPDANAATRGADHGEGWTRKSGANRASTINRTAGWATPSATTWGGTAEAHLERKRKAIANGKSMGLVVSNLDSQAQLAGEMRSLCHAETEKPGQLNPEFVCWLMGYPDEWLSCVDWETRSSRKSLRSSSQR